ncbi:MAG: alpha/beta hydrolase [Pseudomonadota bacterium]|jgi:acetyl esterase/lipase|nr:alpha/beta hydrolase [Pseudomonadota bacterium]
MPSVPTAASVGNSWFTLHRLTTGDRSVMAALRSIVEPNKGKLRGPAARVPFDTIVGRTIAPDGVTFREDQVAGIPGWWCEPREVLPGAAILHLHGGWFNWGSAAAYRNLVGHIARSASAIAFVPDYRLAPEHPFPAAIEDAQASLRGLAERGIRRIAVTGDSAGGNLALSLLSLAAASPVIGVRPLGAAVLSPVTDLALSGSSWESRAQADPYFVKEQAEGLVHGYLNGHDPRDPIASPLYASLSGLPPIRVYVGDDEVLLADSQQFVERAGAARVDARLEVWEGMPHGFVGGVGQIEAAAEALQAMGNFLHSRLAPGA